MRVNIIRNQRNFLVKTPLIGLVWVLASGGCSTAETKPPPSESAQTAPTESDKYLNLLNNISDRIQMLETKLTSLNDKVDSTRLTSQKPKTAEIIAHPSE